VGGGNNDGMSGEMGPTPALLVCLYIRQVLASFETVWSRSRLMRLEGGASVPPHSDVNYHWFRRVRVHIPVVTRPEVRFHCGGEDVHMAAGEAWVFDNWREHTVRNPAPDARIHLVADTSGTSDFWRLVARGQSGSFENPDTNARFVAFDPAAKPKLQFERINTVAVMPPAEVEQLTFDLLADLAPVDDRRESADAIDELVRVMIDFCYDWRSLWSVSGDAPGARSHYERLLRATQLRVQELPPIRAASNFAGAQTVLKSRLFNHLLGDAGGSRREAVEFNMGADRPSLRPAGAETVTPEVPQVEVTAPMASPSIQPSGAPGVEPSKPPVLERPIIILSAPRAGSTLLFETLAQTPGVYTIGGESHQLIESIAALRPGRGVVSSNRLTRRDATSAIVGELRQRFASRIHDRDGRAPPPGARVRLLEKTPKNALRVPFLLEVFPDAQFVFLQREPRANLSSMMQAWRAKGWVTYRQLPGWPGPWSLLLPPGYERLQGKPLEEVVAFQWRVANEAILDDLADLPRERWITTRYEALVANPRAEIANVLEFARLAMDARLEAYLATPLPLSKHTHTRPGPDKWKQNEKEIERVMPQLEAIAARLAALHTE
jgi:hypothetical protein